MKPQQIDSLGDVFKLFNDLSDEIDLKTEIRVINDTNKLQDWANCHTAELKASSELRKILRNKLAEVRKANYSGLDREYFESLKYRS